AHVSRNSGHSRTGNVARRAPQGRRRGPLDYHRRKPHRTDFDAADQRMGQGTGILRDGRWPDTLNPVELAKFTPLKMPRIERNKSAVAQRQYSASHEYSLAPSQNSVY